MATRNVLGENLRRFREAQGFTQEDVAEYLGIARPQISYFENGERDIPIVKLNKLADLFGVELEDLIEENSEVTKTNLIFAYRSENTKKEDIESIALFKRFVMNYLKMEKLKNEAVFAKGGI
jgi:transcriptional regulator with XRE-family HTH domain